MNFKPKMNEAVATTSTGFKKAERAINFQFRMSKEDGTEFNTKIAVAWLDFENPDHVDLIKFLDKDPANLKELFVHLAEHSTYVDTTKKMERKPTFLIK